MSNVISFDICTKFSTNGVNGNLTHSFCANLSI